jgi:L-serine/L-threonine ammonia-lyase
VHEIASELRALGAIRWVPTGGTLNEEEEEEEGEKAVPAMPGAFVTCVGGGGLLAGILQGLSEVGWGDDVPVIAAETIGADSLASSVDAGEVVTLPGISSVAKSLGAASPSPTVLEMCLKRRVGSKKLARPWRTTDRDAVEACVKFANDHRVLVEPACGAALAAIYSGKCDELKECGEGPIVVQVCGGAVIDLPTLAAYAKQFDVDFD